MPSKSHYELLQIPPSASQDEIRQAFRRAVSRYHPDKVQHLGVEFQEIAARKTAQITEAYKDLTSLAMLAGQDRDAEHEVPTPRETAPSDDRAAAMELVRRAALVRFRDTLRRQFQPCQETHTPGFDVSVCVPGTWGRMQLRMLARVVPRVDAAVFAETRMMAWRLTRSDPGSVCVFLLGQAVTPVEQLLSGRSTALVVIPVDIGTWQAQVPIDAPHSVAALVQFLQAA